MQRLAELHDVMSDVLSLIRMRTELVCNEVYAAPWSLSFTKPIAHFHIVERGEAWLALVGQEPLRLLSGDMAILPLGAGHILSSDPSLSPTPIEDFRADPARTSVVQAYKDHNTEVVCGQFAFAGVLAPKLLAVLPQIIHVRGQESRSFEWLRLTSRYLIEELRYPRSGSAIVISRMVDLLFIQAVREWGEKGPRNLGWLSGLSDAAIGRALTAIHEDPGRNWTVEALSDRAGLSRSAFAARFTEMVGKPPLRYLTAWRLDLASDQLRAGTATISEIASGVGYGSEAALTRAFKAQFGTTPAAFRRNGR